MLPPAIPAATLVLVREAADSPLAMLIVERAAGLASFGGAMVFPGGRIDPGDERLAEAFDDPLAPAKIAAIRETLEETAVPAGMTPLLSAEAARQMQAELHSGADFALLLEQWQLRLDLDSLTHFARWEPPAVVARRFDTDFFIARAPAGDWHPTFQAGECSGADWLSLAKIEERADQGRGGLFFPTHCNVARIGRHSTYAALLADAANHPVEPVRPIIEERDGQRWLTIPPKHGYPVNSLPMDRLPAGSPRS